MSIPPFPSRVRKKRNPIVKQIADISGAIIFATLFVILFRTLFVEILYVPTGSMESTLPIGTRLFLWKPFALEMGGLLDGFVPKIILTVIIAALAARVILIIKNRGKHAVIIGKVFSYFLVIASITGVMFLPQLTFDARQHVTNGDIVVFADDNGWLDNGEDFLVKRVIGVGGDHVEGNKNELRVNGEKVDEYYLNKGVNPSIEAFEVDVPQGKLWVMGDNRGLSADSRAFPRNRAFIDESSVRGKPFFHFAMPWNS